jgi:hypothetical protein
MTQKNLTTHNPNTPDKCNDALSANGMIKDLSNITPTCDSNNTGILHASNLSDTSHVLIAKINKYVTQ